MILSVPPLSQVVSMCLNVSQSVSDGGTLSKDNIQINNGSGNGHHTVVSNIFARTIPLQTPKIIIARQSAPADWGKAMPIFLCV
jgi:hypothetical protein